jgi:ATP-dependent RNA helicase DeaD
MKFSEFDFHPDLFKGVKIAGFKEPSPIQEMAIPIINNGSDMVGQAHTGTGKTAAFGLPMMDKLAKGEIERALVITPTRELATQVADELYHLGRFAGIRTLTVYGGVGYGRQIALIHKGVQIVVATPGRLKDLYKKGKIDVFNPEIVWKRSKRSLSISLKTDKHCFSQQRCQSLSKNLQVTFFIDQSLSP